MDRLKKLDKLSLVVIVDNESDGLSQPCKAADASEKASHRAAKYQSEISHNTSDVRGGRTECLDFQTIAYAGHGLSVFLQAEVDGQCRTLLFDGGPSRELFRHNAQSLDVPVADIEAAVLSHWHMDHSVGLEEAAVMIAEAHTATATATEDGQGMTDPSTTPAPVIFDLHPKRPHRRGIKLTNGEVIALNNEPELSQLQQSGIEVHLHDEGHTLLDNCFYVSGSIPRNTSYEEGNPSHVSQWAPESDWEDDEVVADERYLAAHVKGKGIVVLSACSHAGIVNVMRDVQDKSGEAPYAVFGGLHLAPKDTASRIEPTIADIVSMDPQLVVAGHCTGWQAKAALSTALQDRYMPSFVGARFSFTAAQDAAA